MGNSNYYFNLAYVMILIQMNIMKTKDIQIFEFIQEKVNKNNYL
jgi:hypothetical protein